MPTIEPGSAASTTLNLVALGLAFAIAGFFAYRYLQLRREEAEDEPESPEVLLADLERAYAAGEMDEAEFRRVREALKIRATGPPPRDVPPPSESPTSRPEGDPS